MSSPGGTGIDSVIELLTSLAAGDLGARGRPTGEDENLDAVIVGINMLAEELGAHREELEQRVLSRTVELEAARQEAMAATRLKSEFLATMSHEIRTPMNGVIGLTRLLAETSLDGTQREYVEALRNAGEALLTLIDDILDFSKLEAGMLGLEVTDLEPRLLLDGVVALISSTPLHKDLELVARCRPEVPRRLVGDEGRLRQILLNLASNAVKFTEHGQVLLTAQVVGEDEGRLRLRFEVADTGIGIPEEARRTIFDSFTQADPSTTRKYGGTGLGLAISRSLTEAMGGVIGVESEPGVGSTFWFEVPLRMSSNGRGPEPAPAAAPSPSTEATSSTRGRVLVVEDNAVNQMVAEGLVTHLGYDVDIVDDGAAALDAVAATRYAAVLMDCHMPVMDGFSATEEIRRREAGGERLPIIAMTAGATSEDRDRCVAAGMDDYVSKPVDLTALGAALGTWARPGPS